MAATAAARSLASRSIHIRIHPTARTLPERREVLRVLERFGEVEMFRSLKYDLTSPVPNAFLSILSTEEAAKAAVDASPIRYRLFPESVTEIGVSSAPPTRPVSSSSTTSSPDPALGNSSQAHSSDPKPNKSVKSSSVSENPEPTDTCTASAPESIFELRISHSPHPHTQTIQSSPLYGPFIPISPKRSPITADLAERIPEGVAKSGLCDWVTDSVRAGGGARSMWKEEGKVQWGRSAGVGTEATKPWRLRDRERVRRERDVPVVMKGLIGLRRKGGGSDLVPERHERT